MLIPRYFTYYNETHAQGAVVDGEIKQISLEDYKGKWTVVFFYPKDFTYVVIAIWLSLFSVGCAFLGFPGALIDCVYMITH